MLLLGLVSTRVLYAQTAGIDAVYRSSLADYADPASPALQTSILDSGSYPESTWQKLTYTGKVGPVPALFFQPTATSSAHPVPCLLLLHGLGGRKEQMIPVARFFAAIGYASLIIDDVGAGERKPAVSQSITGISDLAANVVQSFQTTVVDWRRGIDYLQTQPQIDHSHVAAMGFSLGALVSTVLGGVEPRICAVILVSGGGDLGQIMVGEAKMGVAFGKLYPTILSGADPDALEQMLAPVDPVNFAGHIAPRPLLMEHGKLDNIIPPANAQALYDAAEQPKQIVWFPDAGHIPPPLDIYPSISIFLDKYLPAAGR